MSVSAAATIACFQFSCTGDSSDDTMRVPIWMPSAPSAKAAAIVAPSTMPPAAMIGTRTFDATSGSSTIVATSRGFLKPPPSPPSTTSPSTPASIAFSAPCRFGTTWNTVSPAALSWRRVLRRLAGRGGHEAARPARRRSRRSSGSRTKACAMFTPNGLSVRSRILRISSFTASSSPDEVSMMPMRAGVRDRRRELRARDPAHRRLHDRDLDAEQFGDAIAEHGRSSVRADGTIPASLWGRS